jgi:hypothetical protein
VNSEKVLSLDISTKTGWAFAISSDGGIQLEDYGAIPQIHEPEGEYPSNYVMWAYKCYAEMVRLIEKYSPQVLVIEETSKGSKNAFSQKILEWSHFLLAQYIKSSKIKAVYLLTEQWRREIGCQMTKEEKKRNKEVREYKKKNKTVVAYDINGKRTGLIGRKHVNIRRVSEIFVGQLKAPLMRKDEDLADGLGLLACYHFRRIKDVAKGEEVDMEDLFEGKI